MNTIGFELVLDLYHCQSTVLNDAAALERLVREAVCRVNFDIVKSVTHQFPHQGVTLVLILAQSHATLHTWPEAGFVAADVYVCGEAGQTRSALKTIQDDLVRAFAAGSFSARVIERGLDIEKQAG